MIFKYICINQENNRVEGTIDSQNLDTAISELQKKDLTVVSIKEGIQKGRNEKNVSVDNSIFKQKITTKDIVIFSRQIAILFEAGVSALKSFRLLATENTNRTFALELTKVADSIESGISLSNSLAKNAELFPPFYINMVKAGEESGKLNDTFMYLADHLDREYELTQKLRKAITYPIFVVVTFIIVLTIMLLFVVPKISGMFSEQNMTLPLVTRIVIGLSNFVVDYFIYGFPCLIFFLWVCYKYNKTENGKRYFDSRKLEIPLLNDFYKKSFLTRLSDNMNTMITSGVPIVHALEITANVLDNLIYRDMVIRISKKVESGVPFSKALYDEEDIPNILVQMVRIGEETGKIGYVLKNLANFYKRELDNSIDNLISLIEPIMIVGLGVGVGGLVAAILLPMYSLASNL